MPRRRKRTKPTRSLKSSRTNQVQITAKRQELSDVQEQITQKQQENEELERLIGDGSGNDDAIIERAARDDLGYARPSERIFYDISGK